MSTVQDSELKCPQCGENAGVYELNCRNFEDWFSCQACGWGYQHKLRRFGQDALAELKALVAANRLPEAWPQCDAILIRIRDACRTRGWNEADDRLLEIEDVLSRSIEDRNREDVAVVAQLCRYWALFEEKDGKLVYDRIDEAPKLVKLDVSRLRPMSELEELLDDAQR